MILRVQHIGIVVRDLHDACDRFERVLGLPAIDFRDDQGQGMQLDARILLGNECWLHLVQNWNPATRVHRFLRERGEGLEHICIETDSIDADVAHLREIGVGVWEDRILDANDGYEAFVFPDKLPGLTVELIESHDRSWVYPPDAVGEPISTSMAVTRLHHIGLCVHDLDDATRRFERFSVWPRGIRPEMKARRCARRISTSPTGARCNFWRAGIRRRGRAASCGSGARGWNTSRWRRATSKATLPGCASAASASSTTRSIGSTRAQPRSSTRTSCREWRSSWWSWRSGNMG